MLMREDHLPGYIQQSRELKKMHKARANLMKQDISIYDAVEGYLNYLYSHIIEILKQNFDADEVENTPFVIMLTLPSMWKVETIQTIRLITNEVFHCGMVRQVEVRTVQETEAVATEICETLLEDKQIQVY
jgi:hypothetical protein